MTDQRPPAIGDWITGTCAGTGLTFDGVVIQILPGLEVHRFLYRLAVTGEFTATALPILPTVEFRANEGPYSVGRFNGATLAEARQQVLDTMHADVTRTGITSWYFARVHRTITNSANQPVFSAGERILAGMPAGGWAPEPYEYVHAFSNDRSATLVVNRYDISFETLDLRNPAERAKLIGRKYRFVMDNGARLPILVEGMTRDGLFTVTNTIDHQRSLISPHRIVDITEQASIDG